MSKGSISIKDGKIVAGLDTNEDGENSVSLKLSMTEAVQEGLAALKKGEKKEIAVDVKAVKLVFEGASIKVVVDTDKDGEELLELDVDMAESAEEVFDKILGK